MNEYHIINKLQEMTMVSNAYKNKKDTFMTKLLTREDANQPYWKEKFIIELPPLFVEKFKNKYREQYNGIVPFDILTYGDITSMITKTGLDICNDIKINKQMKIDAKLIIKN
ncbi:hypothetical protein CFOL_v3_29681 [Cephalotus follicularis]|uniref:Uncharacterized protein n=1 Tax=Cephalotus follicularis TaxID=3775 RepID=A0A1Q3D1S4_CEPFO|nr:hypothetical protein CFOL_v3_29681 [Cephalotus follicularis]